MPLPALPELLKREAQVIPSVEGKTFTSDPRAKLYMVMVRFRTGLRPCRESVRALNAAQALTFIENGGDRPGRPES